MAIEGGPYVQAACFCEHVLEDKQGVLSLIRIIDTITHNASGSPASDDMPPITFPLTLVLMLKSGKARGRHTLKIVPELPNGSALPPIITTVYFEGEEKGQNQVTKIQFTFEFEGLYWFDVYLDEEKLTAVPMRVKYNRIILGS